MERWTRVRKAEVLRQIECGELTIAEALETYNMSLEELFRWQELFEAHGKKGLRTTRVLFYRPLSRRPNRGKRASFAAPPRPNPARDAR